MHIYVITIPQGFFCQSKAILKTIYSLPSFLLFLLLPYQWQLATVLLKVNQPLPIFHSRNTALWRLLRLFGWVIKNVQIPTTRTGKKNIALSIFPLCNLFSLHILSEFNKKKVITNKTLFYLYENKNLFNLGYNFHSLVFLNNQKHAKAWTQ